MHYTFLRSLILQCCCCYCRYYIRKAHRGSTRWILFLEGRLSVHYLFSFMNYSSRSRRQCYHATAICFSAVCDYLFFFLCESNTSGTAERICSVYMFTFTNSHGRCLCPSLGRVWMSRSTVKGQGHQGQKNALCTPAACERYALAANNVTQQRTGPFRRCRGVISAACVRFMFGKTSLALVFIMVALCNRADRYIFALFLSSVFPRLISAVGDWMSTILRHMVWP